MSFEGEKVPPLKVEGGRPNGHGHGSGFSLTTATSSGFNVHLITPKVEKVQRTLGEVLQSAKRYVRFCGMRAYEARAMKHWNDTAAHRAMPTQKLFTLSLLYRLTVFDNGHFFPSPYCYW